MSFPRYPSYKNSDAEWLDEVPGHWSVGSLRWLTRRYSGGTPDKTNLSYWDDGTIPWLNSGAVNDGLIHQPSTYITVEAFQNSSAKWIPEGSLVMALAGQGKTKGMVAQLAIPSTCNQSMAAIIPGLEINVRLLFWWLQSNYQNIRNMAGGDLRDGLNLELLGNIRCPLAPLAEQTSIAAFLDRETAKIDELIGEQRRLIALLKEKRQAVISHAVTKGLNPHAPIKPSGIEWLGDVPEHWEVMPMKRLIANGTSISYGIVQPGDPLEKGIPFVQTTNMSSGTFELQNLQRTTQAIADLYPRSRLTGGKVILGIRALIGAAHVVPTTLRGANLSRGVARIVPNPRLTSPYLVNYLGTNAVSRYWQLSRQGSTFNEVLIETVREISVCVPPTHEQYAIVDFVRAKLSQFESLTAEAQRAIDLLQERRTALISAAVTSKIDVRGLADSEAA